MTSVWPLNVNLYHCCAGKASWMQCPLHNQKVNKPSFHGASCQLAPFNSLNTQSTVLTNSSVTVASVVYGEWRWQPSQNLLNSVFYPICLLVSLNAEVLVVVVVVGCVQGSWSQVSTFSCHSHCLPLTQNASKGYENNFQEPVYNTI